MKKLLIIALVLGGCNYEHHDKIIMDAEGNIYRLEWAAGRSYKLNQVSNKDYDALLKLKKSFNIGDTIK